MGNSLNIGGGIYLTRDTWLDARRTALELGLAEQDAQARADATLQREVGANSPRFGHERHEPVRNPGGLEDTTNG